MIMPAFSFRFFLPLFILIPACSGYQVSVNDNVLYTPRPLLAVTGVADKNLLGCLKQTIKDEKISEKAQLTRLRCTHAGIDSVAGLEQFYALRELDLSNNAIDDIAAIGRLGKLTTLILTNNRISNTEPLLHLLKLSDLRIEKNKNAQCKDLHQVADIVKNNRGSYLLPHHCQP